MSIRRAARHSFGHRYAEQIVIGGWVAKALALAALVGGAKWAIDRVPADMNWLTIGLVAAGSLLLLYVLLRLFRPRIRG